MNLARSPFQQETLIIFGVMSFLRVKMVCCFVTAVVLALLGCLEVMEHLSLLMPMAIYMCMKRQAHILENSFLHMTYNLHGFV